jgi:Uma2 family endonuclease
MTISQNLMTADELWRMPDDGNRRELVNGELNMMAPAGGGHGEIANTIAYLLTAHVKAKKLGTIVAAETGFVLSRDPDTVRAPDAAFISKSRIPPNGLPINFIPFAPDIAVEVLSPSDSHLDVDEKIEQWINAGTALVWIVNPRSKTVSVYQKGRDPHILRNDDVLEGLEICPGFSVKVSEIFEN